MTGAYKLKNNGKYMYTYPTVYELKLQKILYIVRAYLNFHISSLKESKNHNIFWYKSFDSINLIFVFFLSHIILIC